MELLLEAIEKAKSGGSDADGRSAEYIRINENWGLKWYRKIGCRDSCYNNQARAYKLGVAPKLGDKVEFDLPEGPYQEAYTAYGFLTEHCPYMCGDYIDGDCGDCCCDCEIDSDGDGCNCNSDYYALIETDAYGEMMDGLSSLGINFLDNHPQNFGWMDSPWGDKMVCIDFDENYY